MNTDVDYLLTKLIDNLETSINNLKKIINVEYKKNKDLQIDELNLLSNISTNIHRINDETEELLLISLDKSNDCKTADEISKIREMKINNKVQKILMPYMIYLKTILENNDL